MAKGQLVFLRDGLRGLEETITDDGRPALAEAAGPIMKTVSFPTSLRFFFFGVLLRRELFFPAVSFVVCGPLLLLLAPFSTHCFNE